MGADKIAERSDTRGRLGRFLDLGFIGSFLHRLLVRGLGGARFRRGAAGIISTTFLDTGRFADPVAEIKELSLIHI